MDCLDLLVSSGAAFQVPDVHLRTPLHYAAEQGHLSCLFTLVGQGARVNQQDKYGCSSLHLAARGDTEGKCVEYLLQHQANPISRDSQGFTAVHYAVESGNQAGLEKLLSVLSPMDFQTDDMPRLTPLHLAAYHGHNEILRLMLPLFSNYNLRENNGRTPLDLAAYKGNFLVLLSSFFQKFSLSFD